MCFQYFDFSGARVDDNFGSFFVGGGFYRPMGPSSAFVLSAMYNLSYDSNEPSPYGSPWVISATVGATPIRM